MDIITNQETEVKELLSRMAQEYNKKEKVGKPWAVIDTRALPSAENGHHLYESTFAPLLQQFSSRLAATSSLQCPEVVPISPCNGAELVQTFRAYCTQRKKEGGSTHVIDLFGQGTPLLHCFDEALSEWGEKYSIDSVVGLCMNDPRNSGTYPKNPKQHIIEADVFDTSIWARKIPTYMEQLGIKGFDLLLCRPAGASSTMIDRILEQKLDERYLFTIFYGILRRAYRLMSPHNSRMYVQLSEIGQMPQRRNFVKLLREAGIKITTDSRTENINSVFLIEKASNSPHLLPSSPNRTFS